MKSLLKGRNEAPLNRLHAAVEESPSPPPNLEPEEFTPDGLESQFFNRSPFVGEQFQRARRPSPFSGFRTAAESTPVLSRNPFVETSPARRPGDHSSSARSRTKSPVMTGAVSTVLSSRVIEELKREQAIESRMKPDMDKYKNIKHARDIWYITSSLAPSSTDNFFSEPVDGLHVLPDTGAVENVCGAKWAQKAVKLMHALALPYEIWQQPPRTHGGVGEGRTISRWKIKVPMSVGKRHYDYIADVVEGPSSGIPALMGTNDMSKLDVHYSVKTGAFIIPGPGGLDLGASPGTEIIQMRREGMHHHWFCQSLTICAKPGIIYPWRRSSTGTK